VKVVQNPNDDNKTDVTLGIKPIDIMDFIEVDIAVGDVVRNGGVS